MTVHAIQIRCATEAADDADTVPKPAPPDLPSVVPERVERHVLDKFEPVVPAEQRDLRPVRDATDHLEGLYRFQATQSRAAVLDAFERNVVIDAEWYQLLVHDCEHDQPLDERGDCPGWAVARSKGPVPDDV